MTAPKAGHKGAVYISTTKIGGSTTWTYSGETRNMQPIDEFEEEIIKSLPLQIIGGDIVVTGNYKMDTDAGQKLLKTYFDSAQEITDIRLSTDKSNSIWMTPKAGSHVIVTNVQNIGDDKSGIGTFTCTLHVNGELEQVGSTTAVAVLTTGYIDITATTDSDGTVTLIGELIAVGGQTGVWPKVQFEYGETISYGDGPTALQDMDHVVGMFDAALSGLSTATYHYRAVAVSEDSSKKYGVDKTVVIPAA